MPDVLFLAMPELDQDFTKSFFALADSHQFRHDPFRTVCAGHPSMVIVAATHGDAIVHDAEVDLEIIIDLWSPIVSVVEVLQVFAIDGVIDFT